MERKHHLALIKLKPLSYWRAVDTEMLSMLMIMAEDHLGQNNPRQLLSWESWGWLESMVSGG